ncbi:MAG: UDP-N-acetylmuramate dehydrogenase [Clostridium sp.]|nr:UDP-N-acetylmuramate dehydrogenase [Clostridium sp.]MCM1398393.1 UDP-N-acetylmuramate dehydrogenase [Clostridium sp.]MCM1458942.1 UDP-N-acetylmuramate dehydrogenase [Bacteroides sp.]
MQDSIFDYIDYMENEPLSKHTTFRIGGCASYYFKPKNPKEIYDIITHCKKEKIRYYVLGNGSNVLFSDDGFDGIIIEIYSGMREIRIEDDKIYADAGALLSKLAATARDNGLTGLEFASGIPGTLGGGIVMNAGAYGGEMKDIVEYVDIMEQDGHIKKYLCEDMKFGYRTSIATDGRIVTGAMLKLEHGSKQAISDKMEELKKARTTKQPLEYPSAGSTFKRPVEYFAGKLIEDAGLKGYRVGNAMVSEKHCGFVINCGGAESSDVCKVIRDVSDTVFEKFGVRLEPEVKIVK